MSVKTNQNEANNQSEETEVLPTTLSLDAKTQLARLLWWFIKKLNVVVPTGASTYPDLSPTSNATNIVAYSERLNDLLVNRSESVKEIAITAPYSAGKSSFINTFIKSNIHFRYVNISLASFDKLNDKPVKCELDSDHSQKLHQVVINNNENTKSLSLIEKSIVQQLLYRTSSNKTPQSRFRRIFPKPLNLFQSYFFTVCIFVWAMTAYFLYEKYNLSISPLLTVLDELQLNFATLTSFLISSSYLFFISVLVAVPFLLFKDALIYISKINISKINPIKGEIEVKDIAKESIFNRYLEEIIYFFSVNKTDVVIFEDLDRFKNTDIFVKLKELNKLVNDSFDVDQPVRFVYALRDELFQGKDRTKFFDSIIPIIPVANSSNAYPLLLKIIKEAGFESDLTEDFLKDIAVFIDDMRMLKNIVSEYGIYYETLSTKTDIDEPKLFAFICYKNVYCDDFAELHQNKGQLVDFFNKASNAKLKLKNEISKKIKDVEETIRLSESEFTKSIVELNAYCILKYAEEVGHGVYSLNQITLAECILPKNFDSLIDASLIKYRHQLNSNPYPMNSRLADYIESFEPTYFERKERINNKLDENKIGLIEKLRELRSELQVLSTYSTTEILSKKSLVVDDLFEGIDQKSLLYFLLSKEYLDHHYNLYISLFYEGNMTKNDMDFFAMVRKNIDIHPSYKIDNCGATVKYLKGNDFSSSALFNYDLINHLLESEAALTFPLISIGLMTRTTKFMELLESIDYIRDNKLWVNAILKHWHSFFEDLLNDKSIPESDQNALYVYFFKEMDFTKSNQHINGTIKQRLSKSLEQRASIEKYFPATEDERQRLFSILSALDVHFDSLEVCRKNAKFLEYVLKYRMAKVTYENIKLLFNEIVGKGIDQGEVAFDELRISENVDFNDFVDVNLQELVGLLINNKLENKTDESFEKLLMHNEISLSDKSELIDSLDNKVSCLNFKLLDVALVEKLIHNKQLQINSDNVNEIIMHADIDDKVQHEFLMTDTKSLLSVDIKHDLDSVNLSAFLLNSIVSSEEFELFAAEIDLDLEIEDFNSETIDKLSILISKGKFELSSANFEKIKILSNDLIIDLLRYYSSHSKELEEFLESNTLDPQTLKYLIYDEKISNEIKQLFLKSNIDSIMDWDFDPMIITLFSLPEIKDGYERISSIPEIPYSIVKRAMESVKDKSKRKLFITGQLQYLGLENFKDVMRSIDSDFVDKMEKRSYYSLSNSLVNQLLLIGLRNEGLISSFQENYITGFRVNFKKS